MGSRRQYDASHLQRMSHAKMRVGRYMVETSVAVVVIDDNDVDVDVDVDDEIMIDKIGK